MCKNRSDNYRYKAGEKMINDPYIPVRVRKVNSIPKGALEKCHIFIMLVFGAFLRIVHFSKTMDCAVHSLRVRIHSSG